MKNIQLFRLDYFSDSTAGEAGDATTTQAAAETSGESNSQDAAVSTDTEESFDSLIKGKYKSDYTKAVQKVIDKRFAETKNMQKQLDGMTPILDVLSAKYGIDRADIKALAEAVEGDDSLIEDIAADRGYTSEQYREVMSLQRQNEMLLARQEEAERQQYAQQKYAAWKKEETELKGEFPDFDLASAIQDENFRRLITESGMPLRVAYVACNYDGAMQTVAKKVSQKTADNIAARNQRPLEGGLSGRAATTVKTDVSKMSDQDIEDLANRAMRGEVIRFS